MPKATKSKATAISPPVIAQPERLPLNDPNFSWEQFEAFCRHFISLLPDVEDCHHYGKRGNRQRGIDLIAVLRDGKHWVFQCKQYKRFTKEQVDKVVNTTTYKADRYILLLACEATSEVRDEVSKHPAWWVWDVRDISNKVRHMSPDNARRLIETHFDTAWRNKFLGLLPIGAFVIYEQFFAPLTNPANLFNHSWTLIGRDRYTAELHRFISSPSESILVLIGRGGIGKTKILHNFASNFDQIHADEELRFIVEGLPLTDESIEAVPNSPCTIIADDAHRREDLPVLLAVARRRTPRTKVILAIRPGARERVLSLLTQSGFDARETVVLDELKELSFDEVKILAGQALGDPNSVHISALAAATRDSPLITLIGGRLLAEEAVDVRLLERHDEFRQTVLTRFQDVLVGQVADRIEPELCRELLRLLAGVSPFRTNNDVLIQAAADFLDISSIQLTETLGILEEAGVLIRRGYTLRITPDVLADHILHKACLTEAGEPTRYAESLFEHFASICPAQVLSNLSELDWRIHRSTNKETNLLEAIWQHIQAEFASASNAGRSFILDVLREAAYHQPGRVLQIVEFALRNPAQHDDEGTKLYQFPQGSVLSKLPELLKRISYTLDYLPRCCELLWELGRDDSRPTGPNPGHGMRILEDFAGYDLGKPITVNKIVVEAVGRQIVTPDAHDHAHSLFTILNGVLQKSAHTSHSEGHRIVSRAFVVSRENTAQVRAEALRLVMSGALSERLSVSLKAIQSLKIALQDPAAYYDMVITNEVLEEWEPDTLEVLDLFDELIGKTTRPLIHLEIIEAIRWHAHLHKLPSVRQRALEVLSHIPETHDLCLMRALTNGYDFYTGLNDSDLNASYEARQKEISDARQLAVDEFLGRFPDAVEGMQQLNYLLMEIAEATDKQPQPWAFLQQLAGTDMNYAAAMCEAIMESPESILAPHLADLLPFVNHADTKRASDIARRVIASKGATSQASVELGLSLIVRSYRK